MEKNPPVSKSLSGDYVAPGLHLLIDFWGAKHAQDLKAVEHAMRAAATACGATVLDVMLHSFGPQGGVTGVAILAESHISIHTWPETDYMALDVFVCGNCDAQKAADELVKYFQPARHQVVRHRRGSNEHLETVQAAQRIHRTEVA
jgi:S-adenosylmethionine decarboxylase